MKIAGQIHDFATERDIEKWTLALQTANSITINDNACYGVGHGHVLYDWFVEDCFSRIQTAINEPDMKLIFAMYLNETRPWNIHTDSYHTIGHKDKRTAYSLLIPLSVDNDVNLADQSHTIVFNEHSDTYMPDNLSGKKWPWEDMTSTDHLSNSAAHIYQKHLSHNSYEKVNRFTIQGIYQWKRGSLIWWNGTYFHDSDNFIANGYKSKQAIVIHCYYDC